MFIETKKIIAVQEEVINASACISNTHIEEY